jgi:hypothetical protein
LTIDKLITVLFDAFEYIEDEEVFKAVVIILVKISREQKDIHTNSVFKICLQHPNQRFFSETLLHLFNKADM